MPAPPLHLAGHFLGVAGAPPGQAAQRSPPAWARPAALAGRVRAPPRREWLAPWWVPPQGCRAGEAAGTPPPALASAEETVGACTRPRSALGQPKHAPAVAAAWQPAQLGARASPFTSNNSTGDRATATTTLRATSNNSTSHKQQLYDPQATIPRARAHRAGRVPAKRSCTRRGAALGTRLRRRDTHGELSPFTRATAPWRLACASAAATRCRVTGALTVTVCGAVAARAGAAGGLRLRSCPRGLACGSARGGRRDALTQRAGTACVCLLARLTGRLQADVQTVSHPESVPETTNKCNREGGSRTEAWHAQTGCRAQPAGRPGGGGGRLARPLAMARQAAWPHAPQTCRAQSPEVGGASARGRRGRGCHGRFRTAAEGRCRQCLRMQLRPSLHSRSRPEGDGGWALQTVVTHT